jgi:hypothetical protein
MVISLGGHGGRDILGDNIICVILRSTVANLIVKAGIAAVIPC